jgi:hypothetical protein
MKKMIFVGCKGIDRSIFKNGTKPTFDSHGEKYNAVIGPFLTMRGARFMCKNGRNNPHCQTVSDAEKLGKLYRS